MFYDNIPTTRAAVTQMLKNIPLSDMKVSTHDLCLIYILFIKDTRKTLSFTSRINALFSLEKEIVFQPSTFLNILSWFYTI